MTLMKNIKLFILVVAAVATFGFVSYNSVENSATISTSKESVTLTALKGSEKSGFAESNQNW